MFLLSLVVFLCSVNWTTTYTTDPSVTLALFGVRTLPRIFFLRVPQIPFPWRSKFTVGLTSKKALTNVYVLPGSISSTILGLIMTLTFRDPG